MGLVSSNKSWANFSNRSDSNYTRDNCCIFDVYTTSRKFNIRNSDERLNAIRFLSPRRCWLDNTSNPPEIRTFYLSFQYPYRSIFQPIDFLENLIRGGRLNRPRDPKFSAHRSKRSVFLFLFFLRTRHKLETRRAFVSSSVNEEIISLSFFVAFTRWMENRGIDEEREERSPIRPGTRPAIRNRSLEEIIVSGPPERESRYPTFPGI